jgi:predicted ATP-dependent serine protease
VRGVSRAVARVREAAALGFARVALPARDAAPELELPAVSISRVGDLAQLLHRG